MRSLRDETKFHQMWRGPSIGAPPTITRWAWRRRLHGDAIARAGTPEVSGSEAIARDVDLAVDHVDGAFLVAGIDRKSAPASRSTSANTVSDVVATGERCAEERADDNAHRLAVDPVTIGKSSAP